MMEEKSRGFSLRQKKSSRRPPISAPRQIPSNLNPAAASLGRVNGNGDNLTGPQGTEKTVARPRPKLEGGTSDIVKRRYSTRFTNVPKFTADGVPSVPALPTSSFHSAQSKPEIPSSSHQKISIDQGALRDTGLDADKCKASVDVLFHLGLDSLTNEIEDAKSILSEASDKELREYQATLLKIKNRTSSDLQQNVYQNRTQFIKISKEAEKLKGEMRTLRGLMSELASSLSQASVGFSAPEPRVTQEDGVSRARKLANRSSLANLEAMWTVQLHALWKNVEGSQKFLPAIPGRHVLHESGYWLELDAATWKVRRPAHIFLLNDHLLVATKKKKQLEPPVIVDGNEVQKASAKLIADNCWPLQDIDVIDITSSSAVGEKKVMSNAISIRHGHKSFTYRLDKTSSSEKANLLLAFRRAADELRKSLRTDTEDTNTRVAGITEKSATGELPFSKKPDLRKIMINNKDRSEILVEVDGKHQNLRWVESQIDELDSEIALQKFEDAVRHVEKFRRISRGLKNNTLTQELIAIKVDERARRLAGTNSESTFLPLTELTQSQM